MKAIYAWMDCRGAARGALSFNGWHVAPVAPDGLAPALCKFYISKGDTMDAIKAHLARKRQLFIDGGRRIAMAEVRLQGADKAFMRARYRTPPATGINYKNL